MKMSSRDDETLPLSGFSEVFSADVTVDEDFIPTSQPQSTLSSKAAKQEFDPVLSFGDVSTQPLSGFVDETLPPEALIQETQEKSLDFIPDTETKRKKLYSSNTVACRKKLPVFEAESILGEVWDKDKVLDNSTLEVLTDPVKMEPSNAKAGEGSVTEALVNDSADTVQLGDTPVKVAQLTGLDKLETEGLSPDKCEETQMFDNSVLMLDQASSSGLTEVNSQKLYLNETVDDEVQVHSINNLEVSSNTMDGGKQDKKSFLKEKPPSGTALQDGSHDSSSVTVKQNINFKLNVNCLLIFNAITKKIIQKTVLSVDERCKPKTPPFHSELLTDYSSDKSKRCSTSSSGSVYSDQNGLPFALPKKVPVLNQTLTSESSEESLGKFINDEKKKLERVPWSNENLLVFKMDEILKGMMDSQDLINRPNTQSPKKFKRRIQKSEINRLEHISESSLSSRAPRSETESDRSDAAGCTTPVSPSEEIKLQEEPAQGIQNESNDVVVNAVPEIGEEKQTSPEKPPETVNLSDGLRVFARWTDKQYYSGVLSGQLKNEKWDVLFDDGTVKAIKEDFIMPAAWLKVGSLVFALVDDNYESGQVIDVKRDGSTSYVVQLDNREQNLTIGLSDMSLSDDMASILRENYRPLVVESPQRKADINCDNVLTGKRLREYRTPIRPLPSARIESSGSKKKPASKTKDLEPVKETPRKKKSDRKAGLKSESGHLIEDKTSDSPSGNEVSETPVRSTAKEIRRKGKPRSLIYEPEERQKRRQRNLPPADITAVPGPSGVKFKKKKPNESASTQLESSLESADCESPQNVEKSKRKRKAAETKKDGSPKKSITETEIRLTRGRRK